MSVNTHREGAAMLPAPAVLVFCLLLLVAGYAAAIWRGPAPAQEVRVVVYPPPDAAPAAATE